MMNKRAKIIHEAVNAIYEQWCKNGPLLDFRELENAFGRVYDEGMLEAPDEDAARWRILVQQFDDIRAKFDGHADFYPRMPESFGERVPNLEVHRGARWRLTAVWTERSGNADTIPKFINLLLTNRRSEFKEQDHV